MLQLPLTASFVSADGASERLREVRAKKDDCIKWKSTADHGKDKDCGNSLITLSSQVTDALYGWH
jgi:hypothetical protein